MKSALNIHERRAVLTYTSFGIAHWCWLFASASVILFWTGQHVSLSLTSGIPELLCSVRTPVSEVIKSDVSRELPVIILFSHVENTGELQCVLLVALIYNSFPSPTARHRLKLHNCGHGAVVSHGVSVYLCTNSTAWWQRHMCVSSLHATVQWVRLEPATSRSRVL